MIRIDDIELIDRFIHEELSPLEKKNFEQRVRDDREFSKEVRKHIEAIRTVRSYSSIRFMETLEQQMPDWKSGGYKSYSPSIDTTKIMLRIFIPALILGISYGIFKIVQPSEHQPPAKHEQTVQPTEDTNSTEPAITPGDSSVGKDSTR